MNAVEDDSASFRVANLVASLHGNRATSLTLDQTSSNEDDQPQHVSCELAQRHIDRLVEALYANQSLFSVKVSAFFLNGLTVANQEKFLRALWNIKTIGVFQIGVSGEQAKLPMHVLTKSLENLASMENATKLGRLSFHAILIRSPDQVQDLAQALSQSALEERLFSTTQVTIGPWRIACPNAARTHMLDPMVNVLANMVQTHRMVIQVESEPAVQQPPLMSAQAAQRLMSAFRGNDTVFQRGLPSVLGLSGLGLDDATMEAMTSELRKFPHHLGEVYLHDNPSVTYGSLDFWLRTIDQCPNLVTVQTGMENWDATIKLHMKLNGLGRREAIENGLFFDRNVWCNWLAKLANVQRLVQKFHFQRYCRDSDALVVSSLFLSVRKQPNFVHGHAST